MKHSKHTWIVDVIQEGSAAVEIDGKQVTSVPHWILPEGAKEGDVFSVTHERQRGRSVIEIVEDVRERRRLLDISERQLATRDPKDPGGNIAL
jgi:hypothetical protein